MDVIKNNISLGTRKAQTFKVKQLDTSDIISKSWNSLPPGSRKKLLENNEASEAATMSWERQYNKENPNAQMPIEKTGFIANRVLSGINGLGQGLDLHKIKSRSRLILYTYGNKAIKPVFAAYSKGNVDFSAKVNFDDFNNQSFPDSKLMKFGLIALNYAPTLDIERKFCFKGSDPLSFSINCYILLDDDELFDNLPGLAKSYDSTTLSYIRNNYVSQINKLAELTLPKRATSGSFEEIKNFILNTASGIINLMETGLNWILDQVKDLAGDSSSITEAINNLEGSNNKLDLPKPNEDTLGKIYPLVVPPTLAWDTKSDLAAADSNPTKLGLICGPYRVRDCIIKSFRISNVGLGLYEGGFPAILPLTIELETKRQATYDMFKEGVLMYRTQAFPEKDLV